MSFKNKLQEFCHKNDLTQPVYTTVLDTQRYISAVRVGETHTATSRPFTTKQAAETQAAEFLYNDLLKTVKIRVDPNRQPLILVDGNRCSDVVMKIEEYIEGLDLSNMYIFVNHEYKPPRGMKCTNIIRASTETKNASDVELIYKSRGLYDGQIWVVIVTKNPMMMALRGLLSETLNVDVNICLEYKEVVGVLTGWFQYKH